MLDAELVDRVGRADRLCFHLASAVGVKLVVENPLESLLRNVRGCRRGRSRGGPPLPAPAVHLHLGGLRQAQQRGPARGRRLPLGPSATSRWGYATTKAFGEMLAFGYARRARRAGRRRPAVQRGWTAPARLLRHGPAAASSRQALDGEDLTVYGDGTQSRCFTHVYDTVDAIVAVARPTGPSARPSTSAPRRRSRIRPRPARDRAHRIQLADPPRPVPRRPTARASRSSAAASPTLGDRRSSPAGARSDDRRRDRRRHRPDASGARCAEREVRQRAIFTAAWRRPPSSLRSS